jgi:hypothetical protein
MDNKFLRDFMRQQASLIQSGIPEQEPEKGKGGKKKQKSKHGTANGKAPFGGDDLESRLLQIIKEKPAKKEVLSYFRDRVAELVAADEF